VCVCFAVSEMLRSLSSAITDQRTALKKAIETDRIESTVPPASIKYSQSLQQTLQEVCHVVLLCVVPYVVSTAIYLMSAFSEKLMRCRREWVYFVSEHGKQQLLCVCDCAQNTTAQVVYLAAVPLVLLSLWPADAYIL